MNDIIKHKQKKKHH